MNIPTPQFCLGKYLTGEEGNQIFWEINKKTTPQKNVHDRHITKGFACNFREPKLIYSVHCVVNKQISESHSVVSDSLRSHGHTVHGILQARILEWVAVPFSQGSNPGLLDCRRILYQPSHQRGPSKEAQANKMYVKTFTYLLHYTSLNFCISFLVFWSLPWT